MLEQFRINVPSTDVQLFVFTVLTSERTLWTHLIPKAYVTPQHVERRQQVSSRDSHDPKKCGLRSLSREKNNKYNNGAQARYCENDHGSHYWKYSKTSSVPIVASPVPGMARVPTVVRSSLTQEFEKQPKGTKPAGCLPKHTHTRCVKSEVQLPWRHGLGRYQLLWYEEERAFGLNRISNAAAESQC